jgi:hypothetical protein
MAKFSAMFASDAADRAKTSTERAKALRAMRQAHNQWLAGVLRASLADATAPEVVAQIRAAIRRCGETP